MNRKDALDARAKAKEAASTIIKQAEREARDFTADERSRVKALVDEAKTADARIRELDGDDALVKSLGVLGGPDQNTPAPGAADGASLGERFTKSEAFRDWIGRLAPNGIVPDSVKGITSPPISFSLDEVQRGAKALVTGASDTSAGILVREDWLGLLDGLAQFTRPLTIADLVTRGRTQSDTVSYARVSGFTNNAAPVPEATSAGVIGDGTGGTVTPVVGGRKPESGLALTAETETVKTIAHWIPATKRALSDAAQIRTLIDAFLRYGLDEELEDQILVGNGTGENFTGLLNTPGIQAQAFDTDALVTIRRARTLVRTAGRATPTAIVLNPVDMEAIDLLRDGNGQFVFGGPVAGGGAPTVWGLTRVESEAIPAGTALMGDFRQAILWDREQAAIQVSDSHSDFFVRNLVAILAELRAAFGVLRPAALATVDLTP
jgi:HK97 family phage major capsid protein